MKVDWKGGIWGVDSGREGARASVALIPELFWGIELQVASGGNGIRRWPRGCFFLSERTSS